MLLAQLWNGGGGGAGGTHVGILLADAHWVQLGGSLRGRSVWWCEMQTVFVAPSVPAGPQLPVVHAVSCSVSLVVGVRAEC